MAKDRDGGNGGGACRPTSGPRQAPPWYRAPISTRAPTVLIMEGPGRLVLARRDRDRAGSGEKRAPDPEAQIVVPVVGGVPVAVGRAEILWIVVPGTAADDPATRGPPGFKGVGRVETAAPEDRVAQEPRICMLGVSDPCAHAGVDIIEVDCSRPPLVAKAAQTIAKSPHVDPPEGGGARWNIARSRETAMTAARRDHGLVRVKLESSTDKILLDLQPQIRQHRGVIVEQRKVIHVAQIGRLQDLGDEMIEAIEVNIGEELAGEIADRQTCGGAGTG